MKYLFFLVVSCVCLEASAQLKVTFLSKNEVPPALKITGHIIDAAKYTDNTGTYVIIATETGERKSKGQNDDFRDADVWAYNFEIRGNQYELTWQVHDFIKECPVDIEANYVPKTFAITDLDNNGIAEEWLMYKTICHGDVSPSNLKIIMHEGNDKYAVRGFTKIVVAGSSYGGGDYKIDEAFNKGPIAFKNYAEGLWKKNFVQKF